MNFSLILSNIFWFFNDFFQQGLLGSTFSANCVFIVAVTALLLNLQVTLQNFRLKTDSEHSAFYGYKLVFSIILLECLSLVICLDGFKVQMGILVWIIYMSALMILLLVFLTLTMDEFLFKVSYVDYDKSNVIGLNKSNSCFNFFIFFVLSLPTMFVISTEFSNSLLNNNNTVLFSEYQSNRGSLDFAYSDMMYSISVDIASSFMEYILSGLLQAVCLISVIALIVFK